MCRHHDAAEWGETGRRRRRRPCVFIPGRHHLTPASAAIATGWLLLLRLILLLMPSIRPSVRPAWLTMFDNSWHQRRSHFAARTKRTLADMIFRRLRTITGTLNAVAASFSSAHLFIHLL